MKVTSYGLFWQESEIHWEPGRGNRDSFRLLGRIGSQRGTLRVADFRKQQGIYILYNDYGPNYVGLTRQRGLGQRIKDHRTDRHAGLWSRFSWFGFNPIGACGNDGVLSLPATQGEVTEETTTHTTIGEVEALLIQAMGTNGNISNMKFKHGERWEQINYWEVEKYLSKVAPE